MCHKKYSGYGFNGKVFSEMIEISLGILTVTSVYGIIGHGFQALGEILMFLNFHSGED